MKFKSFLSKRKPDILTYVGLGGMVVFGVMMYRAWPVVNREMLKEFDENSVRFTENKDGTIDHVVEYNPLTVKQQAWVYVRTLWPTILVGVGSGICIIMGNREHNKRNAAIAAAYYISESTLKTYQEKVIEELGEKKERGIREKTALQLQKDNPPKEDIPVSLDQKWTYDKVFYDCKMDKYFRINPESLKRAVAEFNLMMSKSYNNSGSVYDFYEILGFPISASWDEWGWYKGDEDWELYLNFFETEGEIQGIVQKYTIFEYSENPVYKYYKECR